MKLATKYFGAIAQMGEHLLCKQGVVGSIPSGSTKKIAERTLVIYSEWDETV